MGYLSPIDKPFGGRVWLGFSLRMGKRCLPIVKTPFSHTQTENGEYITFLSPNQVLLFFVRQMMVLSFVFRIFADDKANVTRERREKDDGIRQPDITQDRQEVKAW